VYADDSNAFGTGATVNTGHTNSTAIGTDASTTDDNQVMIGTANQTYAMPGITSATSYARQQGALEVATTDSQGRMASDGGAIFNALSEVQGGVAVAIAMENPDLVGSETFGLSGNIGFWNDNVALGFSAMGVLGRNVVGSGSRLAVSGAVGFSVDENAYGRRGSESTVGGRAGAQVTW
jgi:hypothetical protein